MGSACTGDAPPPLAVVGFSFRFPQDAVSPNSFWRMLLDARCASSDFPPSRMNIDGHYHPDKGRLDSTCVRGGHFLAEDLGAFDAPFFAMSAAEAEAMDPQQRLILETTYRALENAGLPMEHVAGSRTSVMAGSFSDDYFLLQTKDPLKMPKYMSIGNSRSMLANRISWFFDLVGPSAAVDTACSSSLMAVDLACQSIWSGDATMGLAIGSNVILSPEMTISLDNLGLLSRDGCCYSFDQRANGYGRGEGVGVLVIKPLEAAICDGDPVRAVIRSSASNQDGKTPGVTQPSKASQLRLIRDTYRKAGLDMGVTRYFEAHGTGTSVGDPIEARAIGTAFRQHRSAGEPLYVGSVKSNLGHLEGASGVAGVIKTILILEKGLIPPNSCNAQRQNMQIDDEFLHIQIPNRTVPWPSNGLRRASVSSFGFGGANSHVVLDDAYHYLHLNKLNGHHRTLTPGAPSLHGIGFTLTSQDNEAKGSASHMVDQEPAKLLVWSSADDGGIQRLAEAWKPYLDSLSISQSDRIAFLHHLAYTLSVRRSHLQWRTFVAANPYQRLDNLVDRFITPVRALSSPKLAFVFTGQGAQWHAMGKELFDRYPVFKSSMMDAERIVQSFGCNWQFQDELQRSEPDSKVKDPTLAQSLCTALQIALIDLFASWNITPVAVIGHSSGEVAAAYCARALSKRSALKVAHHRGILVGKAAATSPVNGAMISVGLSEGEIQQYLQCIAAQCHVAPLEVACINSPKSVTVSGEERQIEKLQDILACRKIFFRRLAVSVAYHSSQMQEVSVPYLHAIGDIEMGPNPLGAPEMISSVTGNWVPKEQLATAEYWVQNLVSPVLFSAALTRLISSSATEVPKKIDGSHRRAIPISHLLEIGPHAALQGPCRDILQHSQASHVPSYLPTLQRNISATDTILQAAGHLHCSGYPIDLSQVNNIYDTFPAGNRAETLSDLPEYSFNHTKNYWQESRLSLAYRCRNSGRLDLLGIADQDHNPMEGKWRNILRRDEMAWIQDHKINNSMIYPAAGMLAMAIEAATQLAEPEGLQISSFDIHDSVFHSALPIPSHGSVETTIHLRRTRGSQVTDCAWFEFRICSLVGDRWMENCTGSICVNFEGKEKGLDRNGREEQAWQSGLLQTYRNAAGSCTVSIDPAAFYYILASSGYQYGPAFRAITALHSDNGKHTELLSDVQTYRETSGENLKAEQHVIHPTTLDAVIHTICGIITEMGLHTGVVGVPGRIDRIWISRSGLSYPTAETIKVHARSRQSVIGDLRYSINAFNHSVSRVLIAMEGLRVAPFAGSRSLSGERAKADNLCHYVQWKPDMSLLEKDELCGFFEDGRAAESEPVQFFTDLDFLILASLIRALDQMRRKSGPRDLPPHLRKYLNWGLHQQRLLESGRSPFSALTWKNRLKDDDFLLQLHEKLAGTSKRGLFVSTICQHLPSLATGELDLLSLLFTGELYRDSYYEIVNTQPRMLKFATYLDALAHKNPHMKILEVGAGTGAMTNYCINILARNKNSDQEVPRYARWDFTDISASFFAKAREAFADQGPRMQFRALNIENDPEQQGFECESYDMVVAFLVLHATANLNASLTNVRKLLKPGGQLILLELTRPEAIRTAFIFGLLDDWWRGMEPERKHSPCVNEAQWNEYLVKSGFSGCDVAIPDYSNSICQEACLILSTAIETRVVQQSPPPPVHILFTQSSTAQLAMAQHLERRLKRSTDLTITLGSLEDTVLSQPCPEAVHVSLVETDTPFLYDVTEEDFRLLHHWLILSTKVVWVNSGGGQEPWPKSRLVDGLFRVWGEENDRAELTTVSLDPSAASIEHQLQLIERIIRGITAGHVTDTEYIEQSGMLHVGRVVHASAMNQKLASRKHPRAVPQMIRSSPPLRLEIGSPGLLDTLQFVKDRSVEQPLKPTEIEVQVKNVGLNFLDVLIALGRLDSKALGVEFAGQVTRVGESCQRFQPGDRVVACHASRYACYVRLGEDMAVVKIPDQLPFAEAAALPAAYVTAWIALHDIANLQRGESVLIHSGAGGTGQAAIQVARYLGGQIFTTVGSESKAKFLTDYYRIPSDHIFSSRNTLFARGVRRLTANKGVDVVFNSLSSDGLLASWESVAPYGRFVEIGKNDILSNSKLPMLPFLGNVTFRAFDLAAMTLERPHRVAEALEHILSLILEQHLCPASPLRVYGLSEIETAFRQMQSGKNIGKTVLEMRPEDSVMATLEANPIRLFDSNGTYVIAGGLGGLGRSVARWFIDRGAKNLLLLSRSGKESAHAARLTADIQACSNAKVEILACDITDCRSLESCLRHAQQSMPPVKGCVQGAVVVSNSSFPSLSFETWRAATAPKAQGSWNLHKALPSGMDFFVLLSSIAGIYGTRGESAYAAGNTFMDGLARYRVRRGEKAVSIDLGLFVSTGVVNDHPELRKKVLTNSSFVPVTESDLHALLDHYCDPDVGILPVDKSQIIVGIAPRVRENGMHTSWLQRPFFQHLSLGTSATASDSWQSEATDFAAAFSSARSIKEATAAAFKALKLKLAETLSLPMDGLDTDRPMHQFGVDSLTAVELTNWLSQELRADIAVLDIMGDASIASIAALAAAKSAYREGGWGND
ncbi:Type I Polyketide synthases (Type I PKS) [Aspergillus tanneri]|uniref:Type I Polyketide synthases (Type I PKS) n=1 Tax=Aspergillus tanneri TaxID=1220188 RepID=A0A5M9MMD0_9EURO|nr:Type I Polyketide synthases (Type I PKS) [Aspergillus tanneri]KAA8646574.1 Type I Polyketide synthases (Type I PKS) [Aspergillus tanneri]